MAGAVKTDAYHIPWSSVIDLVARSCPVTERYGEVCQRYDAHSGIIQWCPFMYGLWIRGDQHEKADCRSKEHALHWMACEVDPHLTAYTVLCLRQKSDETPVGAARPR